VSSYSHRLGRTPGGESSPDLSLDPPPGGDSILGRVTTSLTIGDFSRATHLSVKTLRHYHRVGLLEPTEVDPRTGYRRYRTDQIPVAQIIRRFRDLDMPLEEIHAVLSAPDVAARNQLIEGHLRRLESNLERTQAATASLRDLLAIQSLVAPPDLKHVRVAATPAAAITSSVELAEAGAWYNGAFGELYASLASQGVEPHGPAGGIYSNELFAEDRGEATVFVPCDLTFRPSGRIEPLVIPAAELATTIHVGSHLDIDRSYGALGTYVAEHAIGIEGPIREYYLVDRFSTDDEAEWRTQIGWPVFQTAEPT
jgi:DNA-binding transcriptional MerR regulator/effector-binding domain-containing protein